LAACEQGRRVRYITTAQLVNELVEAADWGSPKKVDTVNLLP
jgi:DNA replication protein DnaC